MDKSLERQKLEKRAKIHQKWLYKGKVISLRNECLEWDDHPTNHWDIIVHPGAVAIIPITKKGTVLLVKQFRRAPNQILLEIPAGTLDHPESPLQCAQRELQEETGFKADTFISLGGFFSTPGFCTEYLHLFIAKDLSESPLPQDEHEAIDLIEISLSQLLEMIDQHQIKDAKTIAGILQYDRWKRRASEKIKK